MKSNNCETNAGHSGHFDCDLGIRMEFDLKEFE